MIVFRIAGLRFTIGVDSPAEAEETAHREERRPRLALEDVGPPGTTRLKAPLVSQTARLRADSRPDVAGGSRKEQIMRKLAIAISIVATALTVSAAASATPPSAVSGTETITGATATVVRTADGNTIIANTLTGIIAGSFTGTFTAEFTTIAHPSGQANDVHGTLTCTCSIAGRSGSVTFRFEGTGSPSATEFHAETIGATGGLAGLHSNDTVDIVGAAVTYSGTAHFDP